MLIAIPCYDHCDHIEHLFMVQTAADKSLLCIYSASYPYAYYFMPYSFIYSDCAVILHLILLPN